MNDPAGPWKLISLALAIIVVWLTLSIVDVNQKLGQERNAWFYVCDPLDVSHPAPKTCQEAIDLYGVK